MSETEEVLIFILYPVLFAFWNHEHKFKKKQQQYFKSWKDVSLWESIVENGSSLKLRYKSPSRKL